MIRMLDENEKDAELTRLRRERTSIKVLNSLVMTTTTDPVERGIASATVAEHVGMEPDKVEEEVEKLLEMGMVLEVEPQLYVATPHGVDLMRRARDIFARENPSLLALLSRGGLDCPIRGLMIAQASVYRGVGFHELPGAVMELMNGFFHRVTGLKSHGLMEEEGEGLKLTEEGHVAASLLSRESWFRELQDGIAEVRKGADKPNPVDSEFIATMMALEFLSKGVYYEQAIESIGEALGLSEGDLVIWSGMKSAEEMLGKEFTSEEEAQEG